MSVRRRRHAGAARTIAIAMTVVTTIAIGVARAGATGIAFAIVHSPNLGTAQGSYLDGVSCSSSTACAAVGHYVDPADANRALVELWNGGGWGIVPVHLPAQTVSSNLYKVSCTAATACMAVGKYDLADGIDHPLAESWDGTSWTTQAVPSGTAASVLYSVSCTAPTACMAVGYDTARRPVRRSPTSGTGRVGRASRPSCLPGSFRSCRRCRVRRRRRAWRWASTQAPAAR